MEAIAEKIKGMQPAFESCQGCDCVKALSELAIKLQVKLIFACSMYPEEMKTVENVLETVEEFIE
ncbi:unnamed protein product [marine sediment metagenome]|uniref:Uncharacterized protein n=1 Tax=marine sediment metagenome TaxID=412755 RepID=X0XU42_9ZZZZ